MRKPRAVTSNLLVLFTSLLLAAVGSTRADTVLFDNINNENNGYFFTSTTTFAAQRFNTDAINLFLTGEKLRLYPNTTPSGPFFLRLYSDASGQPGSTIATLFNGTNTASGQVFFPGYNQPLLPNTNYWLVLGEPAGSSFAQFWGATTTTTGTGPGFQTTSAITNNGGATWSTRDFAPFQAQITANVVPEPGSTLCFLTGAVTLVVLGRRRLSKGAPKSPTA